MSDTLKKYLELQDAWSDDDISEEEMNKLMAEADKLEEQFTKEDWLTLIKMTPNKTAQIEWAKKMREKFPD